MCLCVRALKDGAAKKKKRKQAFVGWVAPLFSEMRGQKGLFSLSPSLSNLSLSLFSTHNHADSRLFFSIYFPHIGRETLDHEGHLIRDSAVLLILH